MFEHNIIKWEWLCLVAATTILRKKRLYAKFAVLHSVSILQALLAHHA